MLDLTKRHYKAFLIARKLYIKWEEPSLLTIEGQARSITYGTCKDGVDMTDGTKHVMNRKGWDVQKSDKEWANNPRDAVDLLIERRYMEKEMAIQEIQRLDKIINVLTKRRNLMR